MCVLSTGLMLGTLVPVASAARPLPDGLRRIDRPLDVERVRGDAAGKYRPDSGRMASVIIKLDVAPVASYNGGVAGLAATQGLVAEKRTDAAAKATVARYEAHVAAAQSSFEQRLRNAVPRAQVIHRLTWAYGGVTAAIPLDRLAEVSRMDGVVRITRDRLLKLQTERSPEFIGAPTTWGKLGGQRKAGEGVIVGVLDTGIWPEHDSYSDPDPLGKSYASPPAAPDGNRACEFSGGSNPGDPFDCNDKLIGADRFMAAYDFFIGLLPDEFTTARDDNGHGTHTSSTAAGNRGVEAEIFGVPRGTVSGIAPRAHVMAYKVCGDLGCFSSDSAAAVDEAIQDGVDVINFSISGGESPFEDPVSLAFLDAYSAGVFVSASAGNSGPGAETVAHREPWVATVGASTTDRHFFTEVTVSSSGDPDLTFDGASLTSGIGDTELVYAGDAPYDDPLCQESTNDGAFDGKVVICMRGDIGRAEKGFNVSQRGAAGMILFNADPTQTDLETDNHYLPAAHIQYADGQDLLDYLDANPDAVASWPTGSATTVQGDVMASFSSRGGPGQTLGISKPDVTAPGVQILAGHSPEHVDVAGGPNGELFQAIAGTSMSSPHNAGAAALLADLHPSWGPGQIKSALMLTASQGVYKEDGTTRTDPFDDGSGRIDLDRAWNPGLSFSASGASFVANRDDLFLANYPSIYVPNMPGIVTVTRKAESELSSKGHWTTKVKSPSDFHISLPSGITMGAGGEELFDIQLDASTVPQGEVRHATIIFKGNGGKLRMPVTIVRGQGPVTVDKGCSPDKVTQGTSTKCTIEMTNASFEDAEVTLRDQLPRELKIKPDSISGATLAENGVFTFTSLAAGDPPDVDVEPLAADGYFDVSSFGLALGLGDEDAANVSGLGGTVSYLGQSWDVVGVVSNGYTVVGGATGEDIQFVNFTNLPSEEPPNTLLAPYWTDLDPDAGGEVYVAILGTGTGDCFDATPTDHCYLVMEWHDVPEFSTPANLHTFQIFMGYDTDASPEEEIYFFYDNQMGSGDGGFLTVGAENQFGNRGEAVYYDGDPPENLPADGDAWQVISTAGTPGETHIVEFRAKGVNRGEWTNCAVMRADTFTGRAVDCDSGKVVAP